MVGRLVGRKKKTLANSRLIKGLSILNGGARSLIPQIVSVKIPENIVFTACLDVFTVIFSVSQLVLHIYQSNISYLPCSLKLWKN